MLSSSPPSSSSRTGSRKSRTTGRPRTAPSLAKEAYRRIHHFYYHWREVPYYRRALESWRTYNGMATPDKAFDATEVLTVFDAKGGTANKLKSTAYAAYCQSLIVMTTANRPGIRVPARVHRHHGGEGRPPGR